MMNSAIYQAAKAAGGISALARQLGRSPAVVQQWTKNRVPAEYCPAIEAVTGVRCEELRPDVQWGVLRGTAQAPEQVAKEAA